MDTSPHSGRKRRPSTSPSASSPPFSKRHAASNSSTPFKDPLRNNSDFSSPIFNRSLDFNRDSFASVNPSSNTQQDSDNHPVAQGLMQDATQITAQNQFQTGYNFPTAGFESGPPPFDNGPALSMPNGQTHAFPDNPYGNMQGPSPTPFDQPLYMGNELPWDVIKLPDHQTQPSQTLHQHPNQDQYRQLNNFATPQPRQLIPVIPRSEVKALGGKEQYQHVNMSGVDDGKDGVSSAASEAGAGASDSDSEEDEVFVDAEEEISKPGDGEEQAAGDDKSSLPDGEGSATDDDDEDDSSSGTSPEDERYMLDDDHRDENAQRDYMDDMAIKMGLPRDQYDYVYDRRGRVVGIGSPEPDEGASDDTSERNISEKGNEDSAGKGESEDAPGSQQADENSEGGRVNEQTGEAGSPDDAGEESDDDDDSEKAQRKNDGSEAATADEEEEANDASGGEEDQVSQPDSDDELEPENNEPQDDIIDLSDEEPDNSLFATYFKKKPQKSLPKKSASPSPAEDQSASFSGGPSSKIKTISGKHTTRPTSSSSPPPNQTSSTNSTTKHTTKPTAPTATWRRHPDIVRDLSPSLRTHQKLHSLALNLLPSLPSYFTLDWSRRYWIAVLLQGKNPCKPSFREKDFIWMKGNRYTTVETVWNAYQTSTMADPEDLGLVLGGVEGVEREDVVGEMGFFGDKFVVFWAVGKKVEEEVEKRGLVEGLVPRGVVEVVDLVDSDEE